jgi:glutamyl-tRNA synthetase, bacterial family
MDSIKKDMANNMDTSPRFRFAPSPTGGLHIGTARTALFNWLAARSMGAKLILRIEDTDFKRSNKVFEDSIISDLKWLGLDWDEFYRQSDRLDIYIDSANKMLKEGKAYRCFCTPQRLEELKNAQYLEGKMSKYDNRCRELTDEEIKSKIAGHVPFAIRFKVPQQEIIFKDLIRDEIRFNSNVFGDFVILKSDNTPSYNFGVVIDDSGMNISHVLRGEDHITNTARQIMLFESIGAQLPAFGHLSMILGKDGAKLSKRHGSQTITEFKAEGYLSDALCNYLALLSWAPGDNQEIFNLGGIVKNFNISAISKSPAIFDIDKLSWINGNHIREKSIEDIYNLVMPFVTGSKITNTSETGNKDDLTRLKKGAEAFRDKMRLLADFPVLMKDYMVESVQSISSDAHEVLDAAESGIVISSLLRELLKLKENEDFDGTSAFDEPLCKQIILGLAEMLKTEDIKGKMLYMPIRAALTGQVHGPELPKVMSILGLKRCILRLRAIVK